MINTLSLNLWSQVSNELALLSEVKFSDHSVEKIKIKNQYEHVHQNTNEVQLLFSGLFLFYKSFISSQDAQSCSFTPSCSVYALEAVKKQGVLKGMMNGFDRLSRCHSLAPEKYKVDPETNLLIDPLKVQ
ncbi:membrane protein insertion efficiency factor YidD [Marivirga tractuosa]|uniref:membrane protein insertion efficiency factor YidD n=1 Tax=Marivirga tractuosa TaxID=1006 RepID=UPI0035CEF71D